MAVHDVDAALEALQQAPEAVRPRRGKGGQFLDVGFLSATTKE